uniref:Uncharacterized protein n=1 Tax=Picea sitchensis TaxID=3332 RepID=D5A949_PICSI|nr:unknown [Picea sitchensis]
MKQSIKEALITLIQSFVANALKHWTIPPSLSFIFVRMPIYAQTSFE